MSRPKIWISRRLSDATLARAEASYDCIINHDDVVASTDELIAMSGTVDGFLTAHSEIMSEAVVAQLDPRLKIIANHSVGTDHCAIPAMKARGITVTNTPDVLSDATAEIAMLLMLGAARRAVEGDQMVRNGKWDFWSPAFMVGKQVTGQRLGIIGMGRVGQIMARNARGMNMEIHYYNRSPLPADQAQGAIYHDTIDSLLAVSDFLSLHCPATADTTGLMNADRFAQLPRGAVFVNTARGALVDETALMAALDSGQVSAAGLDCFAVEPGGNPRFASYDNIFMLPHIGSATTATRDAMGFRALDNLDAYFAGEIPRDAL